ncbi:hypothetical protein BKA69DRAFT_207333 [Paraphysoderma sedebokerense]|nr:hypothetical protein BKA69DRAFT_207333 [Paraphysoderma sedebokerense]
MLRLCWRMLRTSSSSICTSKVLITVRLHGTLQLIDQSENAIAEHTAERKLMYLQEQYALESADILWCQSTFMKRFYSTVYGLNDDNMVLSHPPMMQILRPFEELLNSTNPITLEVSSDHPVFLVYGRMQLVKGLETIVSGVIDLLLKSSKLKGGRFIFAGPDTVLLKRRISTSQYLQSLIPRNLTHHFQFVLHPLTRKDLVQMSRKVRAAVFASDFETFNLAAHELAYPCSLDPLPHSSLHRIL